MVSLYLALDKLRKRYGQQSIIRAVGIDRHPADTADQIGQESMSPEAIQSGQEGSTGKRLWKISRPEYLTGRSF
jgi:hypothetical protein